MLRLLVIPAFTIAVTAGAAPALAKAEPFGVTGRDHGTIDSTAHAGIELAQGKSKKFKSKKFKSKKFKPGKARGGQGIPGVTTGAFSELEKQLTRDFFRRQGGNFRGKSKQFPPARACAAGTASFGLPRPETSTGTRSSSTTSIMPATASV